MTPEAEVPRREEDVPAGEPKTRAARRTLKLDALAVDDAVLDLPLAAPWRRAGAMVVDLAAIGALSLLAGPVLGALTGVTVALLGSRRVSVSKFWMTFRWVLIVLGAAVVVLSLFLMAGRPLVRTTAFNIARETPPPRIEQVLLSPSAGTSELRRAVAMLERQVETLREDNERLRREARGNSFVAAASDFSGTLGLTFGWAGVYFTLFTTWLRGRTPGKTLFRIRVVRLDGRPLGAMDAFVRNGGYAAGLATGSLGFLRLLWDPNRQAIQDKIAGTVVVAAERARPPSAVAGLGTSRDIA
jgi:uncharacterized RDD family membrane protein YckC